MLKERRERPLSTPLGTTSTDAMDTEEAQEFSREIAEAVIEKELKKQKYEQYQQAKQTSKYQVPKSITIPVPDLNKPRQEKASRPTSVLSNFDLPINAELGEPKEEQLNKRSKSMTLLGMKFGEGARPKDSFNKMSAFQDYTSKMMSALNNPWKPRSKKTATPIWSAVPPLVYASAAGTPVSDIQSKNEISEKYVLMNFSAVDKTVLTPQGRQETEGVTSPIKFSEALQNGDALKVNPQGGALMEALGFGRNGDDSSSTDSSAPRKRKHKSPKYVYVIQGPPGPKGQEGQPGQAGRDGRDGQNFTLTKELEETLKAHRPNLDTTGLENSFDQFGRTMIEVLNAQHRTNQKLEEQFRRANETQEYQAEAMQDMAQANFQMKYDHMFAGVPMYDGTNPDSFDDWLYQIESLCELSRRDVRVELMGRASAQVKRIIRSLPMDIEWEIA